MKDEKARIAEKELGEDYILSAADKIKREKREADPLETEILISFPEYLLLYLRRRAREWGCSLTSVIRKMLIEDFMKQGVNVFREKKIDKRSAEYRETREPYARNTLQKIGDKKRKAYQRNPRLLDSEKPRRKTHKRKYPVMESIGDEKPKRKRGRPRGSKNKAKQDVDPSDLPSVLSTDRIKMEGGGCSPHAHVYTQGGVLKCTH